MEHRTNDWVRSKINSLVGPQETPLVTVKRENLHGSGMSHATTASPKPSFRIPWRVGSAVVGRGNAGWTTSKSAHPCPSKNCSQGPPAEKTGRGSLLNCPSCASDDPRDWTELNWVPARGPSFLHPRYPSEGSKVQGQKLKASCLSVKQYLFDLNLASFS